MFYGRIVSNEMLLYRQLASPFLLKRNTGTMLCLVKNLSVNSSDLDQIKKKSNNSQCYIVQHGIKKVRVHQIYALRKIIVYTDPTLINAFSYFGHSF